MCLDSQSYSRACLLKSNSAPKSEWQLLGAVPGMRASTWARKTLTSGIIKSSRDIVSRRHFLVANSSTRFLSGTLTKGPHHVWSQYARGMSSFRPPSCIGATRGMRIVGATPVNKGKQVDMEFADGSAYRFSPDTIANGCKTFTPVHSKRFAYSLGLRITHKFLQPFETNRQWSHTHNKQREF